MKRIYVAGAMSADNITDFLANLRRGIALTVRVIKAGYAPFCPFIDFQWSLVAPIEQSEYKAYSMAWLEAADAVLYVQENVETSPGTQAEIARAEELGIPVYGSLSELSRSLPA